MVVLCIFVSKLDIVGIVREPTNVLHIPLAFLPVTYCCVNQYPHQGP
jgi:hypothetical protein